MGSLVQQEENGILGRENSVGIVDKSLKESQV